MTTGWDDRRPRLMPRTRSMSSMALAVVPLRRRQPAPGPDGVGLILRIATDRDQDAFKLLFEMFDPKVKSYLLRHGANAAQAEDLAQEALLSVWRKAALFDPSRAGAAAWIFTIARNLRIDALRHERSALVYDVEPPEDVDDSPPADDRLVAAQRDGALRRAMQNLPHDQVEVIQLSFFQDKPHSEIARELSLPLGTVKSRVRLALARLRGALGDET